MPHKTWAVGEEVLAADFNAYVQKQVVATFSSAAARAAAIPAPTAGMVSYLADTGAVEVYYSATIGWRPPWNTAWGVVAYAENRTAQVAIVAGVDLTAMSITWTALAGRRYETTLYGGMHSSVGNDGMGIYLTDQANVVKHASYVITVTNAFPTHIEARVIESNLTQGPITRKGRGFRQAGTGNVTWYASATEPAFITARDIGPAANP